MSSRRPCSIQQPLSTRGDVVASTVIGRRTHHEAIAIGSRMTPRSRFDAVHAGRRQTRTGRRVTTRHGVKERGGRKQLWPRPRRGGRPSRGPPFWAWRRDRKRDARSRPFRVRHKKGGYSLSPAVSGLGADDRDAHRASVVVVVAGSVVGDDLDVHDLALAVDRGGVVERLPRAAVDTVEHAADLGALADERRGLDAVPDDVTRVYGKFVCSTPRASYEVVWASSPKFQWFTPLGVRIIVVSSLFSAGRAVGTSEVTSTATLAVVVVGWAADAGPATAASGKAIAAAAERPRRNFFMVFVFLLSVTVVVTRRHHDTTPLTVPEWGKEPGSRSE